MNKYTLIKNFIYYVVILILLIKYSEYIKKILKSNRKISLFGVSIELQEIFEYDQDSCDKKDNSKVYNFICKNCSSFVPNQEGYICSCGTKTSNHNTFDIKSSLKNLQEIKIVTCQCGHKFIGELTLYCPHCGTYYDIKKNILERIVNKYGFFLSIIFLIGIFMIWCLSVILISELKISNFYAIPISIFFASFPIYKIINATNSEENKYKRFYKKMKKY